MTSLMKKYFSLLLVTVAFSVAAQQKSRNVKQEITWLKNALIQHHVEPRRIDDKFSADLFDKLLDDLDPDRIFFTQADLASLQSFRTLLDDEINGERTGFTERLIDQYHKGLQRSETLVNTILGSSIDWKKNEMYDPVSDWPKDDLALADRHRQWLKYQVLGRLATLMKADSITAPGFFKDNISDAIDYVKVVSLRPVTRLLKDPVAYDNKMADTFLEEIASVFDPHSTFFSRHAYGEFVASLSTEDYYFGFTLGEDAEGNVIISALAPGGPAWKSGTLHVSDVILTIKWPGEERIDVRGLSMHDVNELLTRGDINVLEMTVRTVDGSEKKVTLRKEKLQSEANVVQSFILQGDTRTGYIYLPDFYTRWDDEQEGGRCANDVAKEIIRLKKEGIEGLILDLRFNGGGSLFEARAMAGIFIDEGPLAMMRTREGKTVSLKDLHRGTVYDGPLVIMVNGSSASASEVLAGAIQDYNRGLIVGGRTYGKATGQNILPLEGLEALLSEKKSPEKTAGYVKLTTQRLYRLTGKSAQGRGVTPDVMLPDMFSALDIREAKEPFALKPDSVPMNTYFRPLMPMNRKVLQERSRQRVAENLAFLEMQKTMDWLEDEMKSRATPRPLVWEAYLAADREALELGIGNATTWEGGEKIYEVSNGAAKEDRLHVDDYAREMNDRWIKKLSTDIYLHETYQILRDHIHLIKNP